MTRGSSVREHWVGYLVVVVLLVLVVATVAVAFE